MSVMQDMSGAVAAPDAPVLMVEGLCVSVRTDGGMKPLVRDLSFSLRRGETLDVAAHGALQGLRGAADKALARALAAEALRWLTTGKGVLKVTLPKLPGQQAKIQRIAVKAK